MYDSIQSITSGDASKVMLDHRVGYIITLWFDVVFVDGRQKPCAQFFPVISLCVANMQETCHIKVLT